MAPIPGGHGQHILDQVSMCLVHSQLCTVAFGLQRCETSPIQSPPNLYLCPDFKNLRGVCIGRNGAFYLVAVLRSIMVDRKIVWMVQNHIKWETAHISAFVTFLSSQFPPTHRSRSPRCNKHRRNACLLRVAQQIVFQRLCPVPLLYSVVNKRAVAPPLHPLLNCSVPFCATIFYPHTLVRKVYNRNFMFFPGSKK